MAVELHDHNFYGFTPNFGANLAALIGFAILWAWNTVVGLYTKQWWFGIAFFLACGLETAGYIGRTLSHSNPTIKDDFMIQIICLTIAPAFFMAGVYYLLAKLAVIYGGGITRIRPNFYSTLFISCDLFSIVLQGIGGGMSSAASDQGKSTAPGTHTMVAGLAVQVASMTMFLFFTVDFFWRVTRKVRETKLNNPGFSDADVDALLFEPKYAHIRRKPTFPLLIAAIGVCTFLVLIRCIYRLIELAEGWKGYLITHETYFLILEALVVFLGTATISFVHPGLVFGRNTSIPVRNAHKKGVEQEQGELYNEEYPLQSNDMSYSNSIDKA